MLRDVLELSQALVARATGNEQAITDQRFVELRAKVIGDPALETHVPGWLRSCRSGGEFWQFIKNESKHYAERRQFLKDAFDPLLTFLEEQQKKSTGYPFPHDPDRYLSKVVELLMIDGNAQAVALVAAGQPSFDVDDINRWILQLTVPVQVLKQLTTDQISKCEHQIAFTCRELSKGSSEDDHISAVRLVVGVDARPQWRDHAAGWLKGEGLNNQGRVRSDNLPSRQVDGLLFRSQPEIHMYLAFKQKGVTFAPLPVFLRGGQTYQRIEPDFVVYAHGKIMIVEVDGDTVHRESPAEADQRTRMFKHEGALVERVPASDCDTAAKAVACVSRLLEGFEKWSAR